MAVSCYPGVVGVIIKIGKSEQVCEYLRQCRPLTSFQEGPHQKSARKVENWIVVDILKYPYVITDKLLPGVVTLAIIPIPWNVPFTSKVLIL